MGLVEATREYLGRLVVVTPFYGWGWVRTDGGKPDLTYDESSGPIPFHARLVDFFESDGELRGAIGVIEEAGHPYDGQFVTFNTRHFGDFDFGENAGDCNVAIGPSRREDDTHDVTGPGSIAGFGRVRAQDSIAQS